MALITLDEGLCKAMLEKPNTPNPLRSIINELKKKTYDGVNTAKMILFNLKGKKPDYTTQVLNFWGDKHVWFLEPLREIFAPTITSVCGAFVTFPNPRKTELGRIIPGLPIGQSISD